MSRQIGASMTTTVTLENPSESPSPSQQAPPQTLVITLNRKKKKVSWKQGTIDNEFLQKKSSKKCCIFHKDKPFDEDSSDDDDGDHNHNHNHNHQHDHDHDDKDHACSSKCSD